MKKPGFRVPFKLFVVLALLAAAYLAVAALVRGLKNLDYFKVKEVVTTSGVDAANFVYLNGRGIFDIDLKGEAGRIWQAYPAYKKVRLIRILPNRILVDFVKRQPAAYIKLYRYFCVDEELVLMEATDTPENDLPVIVGLDTRIFGPKVGRRYDIRELAVAVEIAGDIKKNRIGRYFKVKTINVSNIADANFVTDGGLEVRVGQENIRPRIELLRKLLVHSVNELPNIKYIDLRFKDPAIKLK